MASLGHAGLTKTVFKFPSLKYKLLFSSSIFHHLLLNFGIESFVEVLLLPKVAAVAHQVISRARQFIPSITPWPQNYNYCHSLYPFSPFWNVYFKSSSSKKSQCRGGESWARSMSKDFHLSSPRIEN